MAVTLLAILFLTCAGRAAAAPLRISYAAIAANIAGIRMAEGSGAFKKYGWTFSLFIFLRAGRMFRPCLAAA
jgi:hypothetical protein